MIPRIVPDVVISHSPPSHKDFSYVSDYREDIGSKELRKFLEENNVEFCFNGHLHLDYSINKNEYIVINGCQCFNVSSKGQLLSVEARNIKIEEYIPSLDDKICWSMSGIRFKVLPKEVLVKVKEFFIKYYGNCENIEGDMLLKLPQLKSV